VLVGYIRLTQIESVCDRNDDRPAVLIENGNAWRWVQR
jgi:hypothetical protein